MNIDQHTHTKRNFTDRVSTSKPINALSPKFDRSSTSLCRNLFFAVTSSARHDTRTRATTTDRLTDVRDDDDGVDDDDDAMCDEPWTGGMRCASRRTTREHDDENDDKDGDVVLIHSVASRRRGRRTRER
jgi:hypothetical protein